MLRLTLNGTPLQLPADIHLNLIFENPLMYNDRIPSSHSLSFNLPATPHNLRILGHPNRLNVRGAFREFNGLDIFYQAQKILTGVLIVSRFDKAIVCFFRGSVITDEMRLPLNEMPLGEFNFGNNRGASNPFNFYDGISWGSDYRDLIHRGIYTDPSMSNGSFVCPPMRVKEAVWPYLSDENSIPSIYGNAASSRMYLNFWNAKDEQYMMLDGVTPVHTACFPFPFLHAVVEAFFAGQVDRNPFSEGDLSRIVLTSTFHERFTDMLLPLRRGILLDGYATDAGGVDNFFFINSFMASIPANELIREALKLISATLYPSGHGFTLQSNSDLIESKNLVDWNSKLMGKMILSTRAAQRYDFGYNDGDAAMEDMQAVEVTSIKDMVDLPVGSEGELDIYVTSTRELYNKRLRQKADPLDPDRFSYELVSSAMGKRKSTESGGNGYNMTSSLQPVKMTVDQYWSENAAEFNEPIEFGDWYVPTFSGDRLERPAIPQIGLYLGVRETFSNLTGSVTSPYNLYPLLSPHNVDGRGNKIGDLSLQWEGPDGLLEKYHMPFKNWVEKDKTAVSADILLSSRDLRNLDLSQKVHLRGKNFFIERLSITIQKDKLQPAQVELIEADLP